MKKFPNNRLSTEPDYENKCLQHLEHDFMVQQYLQQTASFDSNHKSYINILNHISFNNKTKKRQIKHLTHQTHSLASKLEQSPAPVSQFNDINRQNQMLDFQKKIIEQEEIKNHLQAELNEVSKSINLMKGDVSRIIEKNESTNILQKKTSKVKLIAQDQLKKVNLALHKDHSEILERNNMQIRFNKKLKNICNNQNNFLKKIQAEYLRLEKRKNLINEKIVKMEEIMKNLSEREKNKEEIKIINERNKINLEEIMNLYDLIKKIEENGECSITGEPQLQENLVDTHLSLKTQRFKMKIKEIESQIIKYISQVTVSIEKADDEFRCGSEKLNQCKSKLQEIERQQRIYESFLCGGKINIVSEQEKRAYDQKLTNFKRALNQLLIIWQFIENHNNFTMLIDDKNKDLRSSKKQQTIQSRFYRKSEEFQKNTSILSEQNNFSNKFYKLILFLTGNGEQINLESEFIMKSLQMTTIMWLKGLKTLILEKMTLGASDKLKKGRSLQTIKYKSTFQLFEELGELNPKKYRLSLCDDEQDKLKTMLQLISPKNTTHFAADHDKHHYHQSQLNKYRKTEGDEDCKAKRIKILEKVDYDYYRMIKNVLQIQKQNIKKNYDFNKTFNRSKFTEKNIIQQEKRYQSNFALQFIKKNEQSMMIESHRSIASRTSQKEKPFKRRQFHHKTELMNNFRTDECTSSRKVSGKNKGKQAFFNAHKLQRKSKLIERQSEDASTAKEVRTSLFFSKKAMINFADKAIREEY